MADSQVPILAKELIDQIHDIQEQYFEDSLPIEFLDAIGPDAADLEEADRMFVEQLRLVMVREPRIRLAINNYSRAFEQRSKWIREDLLQSVNWNNTKQDSLKNGAIGIKS